MPAPTSRVGSVGAGLTTVSSDGRLSTSPVAMTPVAAVAAAS